MSDLENELKEALENIDGSYDDFVRAITLYTRNDKEAQKKVLAFIQETDSVTTSDVIEYWDELEGVE